MTGFRLRRLDFADLISAELSAEAEVHHVSPHAVSYYLIPPKDLVQRPLVFGKF